MNALSLRLKALVRIKSVFIDVNIVMPAFFWLEFAWFISVNPLLWLTSLVISLRLEFY